MHQFISEEELSKQMAEERSKDRIKFPLIYKIILYGLICYSLTSVYFYLATPDKPEQAQVSSAMSKHVELNHGSQWQSWRLIAVNK